MHMIIDGKAPTAPAPATPEVRVAPVRKRTAGLYTTTDGAWEIHRDTHGPVPWAATYKATGQSIHRPTLTGCQAAIGSGEARAELAAQDAAAMAQPCRGCGGQAAGLVNTTSGPQPVCASCTPRLTEAGRTVRQPAGHRCQVCGGPSDGPGECNGCHVRQELLVARSTDI